MSPTRGGNVVRDYMVQPDRPGDARGLLLLHSGRGLTRYVKYLAERIAHLGYVTLAADLFEGARPTTLEEAQSVKVAVDGDETLRRLEDSVHFLRNHDDTGRRRVAVLGLGYGSTWAIDLAERAPDDVGALVVFYGLTDCDWGAVGATVQGHFAELDHDIPLSRVRELRSTLRSEEVDHEVHVYEGTEPSFFEKEETARYDPNAADLAWQRLTRFLGNAP